MDCYGHQKCGVQTSSKFKAEPKNVVFFPIETQKCRVFSNRRIFQSQSFGVVKFWREQPSKILPAKKRFTNPLHGMIPNTLMGSFGKTCNGLKSQNDLFFPGWCHDCTVCQRYRKSASSSFIWTCCHIGSSFFVVLSPFVVWMF